MSTLNLPFTLGTKLYFSYNGELTNGIVTAYDYKGRIDERPSKCYHKIEFIQISGKYTFKLEDKEFSKAREDFYMNSSGWFKLKANASKKYKKLIKME